MTHTWKLKPNKAQLKAIKKYMKAFELLQEDFYGEVLKLEKLMMEETMIYDIEFSQGWEGQYIGVGNSSRTMKLIQWEDR